MIGNDLIKVLHLLGPLKASGMERMLVTAADYLRAHNVIGTVIGQGDSHPFAPQLRNAGYAVGSIAPLRTAAGVLQLRALLIKEKPDVLHVHTESAFALAVLVARLSGVRVVRTVHNVFQQRGMARFRRRLWARLTDPLLGALIAPSRDVQRNEEDYGRRAQVIINWVGDEFFDISRDPQQRHAAIVGNCSPVKNHEFILPLLLANGYSISHHGDEQNASKTELYWLNLFEREGRLVERGHGDPRESLQRASVFVMPSTNEGMSVALLEALAAGVPAVVAKTPGTEWTVDWPLVSPVDLSDTEGWRLKLDAAENIRVDSNSARRETLRAARGAHDYFTIYATVLRHE